jgi:hypothetical protein
MGIDSLTIYLFSTRRKGAAEMGKPRVVVCRVGGTSVPWGNSAQSRNRESLLP